MMTTFARFALARTAFARLASARISFARVAVTALAIGALAATPALAAGQVAPPVSSASSLYTCEGAGLSRVAFAANPAPCCSGQLGCPQLLSNTGLVKPKRSNRT